MKQDQFLVVAAVAVVEVVYPCSLMVELPYLVEEELQWRLHWVWWEAEEAFVVLRRHRHRW